jgi:hypothetical protein
VEPRSTESSFDEQMLGIYRSAKEIQYYATRFFQMLSERGGLATAKHLLSEGPVSQGFEALWERRRLDLSVEALVLRNPWRTLVSQEELSRAESRLRDVGYDFSHCEVVASSGSALG